MSEIKKIVNLVRKAQKVEDKLPKKAKLLLAKKRLLKIAGVDDPQKYSDNIKKDNSKSSSKQLDDKNIEKIIKDMKDDERHVFSSKLGKLLQKTAGFDESKHPRDDDGKFGSGGGSSDGKKETKTEKGDKSKKDKKQSKTPAEEGTDAVLKDRGFEGVDSNTLDALQESLGEDVQIEDVNENAVSGNGRLVTMDDGSEWAQYDSQDDAREAARESLKNLYDDLGDGGWNSDFVASHQTISETDQRLLAQDLGESDRESIEEEVRDEGDFGEDGDKFDDEVDRRVEERIDEHEERIEDDAKDYLANELGLFSEEEFGKQNYVQTDVDGLIEESIDTDGIAHTLASYDGEEVETKDGKLLYRVN